MPNILLSEVGKIMVIVLTVSYSLFLRKRLDKDMIRGEIFGWIIICVGYFVLKFYSQISLPSVGSFCKASVVGVILKLYSWRQVYSNNIAPFNCMIHIHHFNESHTLSSLLLLGFFLWS